MKLTGKTVSHKTFGEGKIIEQTESGNIVVEFPSKTAQFVYPQAFEKFLTTQDELLQNEVTALLKQNEAEKEAKRAEQHKIDESRRRSVSNKGEYSEKRIVEVKRIDGIAMTFLALMGEFYEPESRLGIIWAPLYDAGGNTLFHWDNVLKVREGDIIFHVSDGYIKAISRAGGSWVDCKCPFHKEEWGQLYIDGRKVDCEYTFLKNPIPVSDFIEENIRYSQVKYSPFDKNGEQNKGYLYDLDIHLASVYLENIIENNPEIAEIDYVQWIVK